ncbi:Hypothetical predicted protein [Mytilus galloprovincialis]|uniref:CCHC-type domain-containing protein n=1 Tax=Mytilus galloprovincialis TaxID=29158 RepID=A0A8B6C5W4_MYTGA|nr:Hypothetical predicted protein [Mytilus galloprovincialis]
MDTDLDDSIKAVILREVKNAVSSSQQDLLNSITTVMDSRLSSFQSNLQQSQQEISQTQIAKLEETMTNNYSFQRKGNENQYRHEVKVLSKLKEAKASLEAPELGIDSVRTAKMKIIEGIDLVCERQKLIKLADSSQLGWKVVSEYVANPIADDSEDEKKMMRAQSRAERKSKAEKVKKGKPRPTPYSRNPEKETKSVKPGRCFKCGNKGHWVDECPDMKNKISNSYSQILVFDNINVIQGHFAPLVSDSSNKSVNTKVNTVKNTHTVMCIDMNTTVQHECVSPVGRLKVNIGQWKLITENKHIIDVIENGYKIPFKTEPQHAVIKNNRSSLNNKKFVQDEISNLLQKKCISEVQKIPQVVNPLTVAYNKSSKPRLVLDCRHINIHLFKFRFKYEDTKVARDMFQKDDFLFSFDLKSAYHHIEICQIHRSFLGFSWDFEGKVRYFVFNVLPFGLATAGYIFSKVLREFVKHLRSEGKRIIMFLDDGLGGDRDLSSCLKTSQEVKQKLEVLGFLIAHEKCSWFPSQYVKWLGYVWDTKIGKICVSDERIDKAEKAASLILSEIGKGVLLFSARTLASIIGQLISMQIVLGDIVRRNTRFLYDCVQARASWNAPVRITVEAIDELGFWKNSCRNT